MTKCIVKGCRNHKHEGEFVGVLCAPCHSMLTTGRIEPGATFVHHLNTEIREARNEAAVVRRAYLHERQRATTAVAALQPFNLELAERLDALEYRGPAERSGKHTGQGIPPEISALPELGWNGRPVRR